MRLTVKAPFTADRHAQLLLPPGITLEQLLGKHAPAITSCQVNGAFCDDWRTYTPDQDDSLTLYLDAGAITAAELLIIALEVIIATAISIGLQYLIRALTPTKSQTEGKPEQVYGIAGLTNTTAQGTPKLICYGKRRVYGHIISTHCFVPGTITDGADRMDFGILYFMGEGPIESMNYVQVDDVDIGQYAGLSAYTRLGGTDNDTLIHPIFQAYSQVWSDNRQLAVTQPVVYQTRSANTLRATIIIFTPFLQTDDRNEAQHSIRVEISPVTPVNYAFYGITYWRTKSISPRFNAIQVDLPSAGQWLLRITLDDTSNAQQTVPTLFNVMEQQLGSQLYPNSALLALVGVASNQIQSFDAMRGSAQVFGRKLKVWNGTSFTTEYTNGRAWVIRDILTDPRVGFGNYIPESLINDDALKDVQDYWNGEAYTGSGIPRDQCDILINDRQPVQDWLKILLSEGRSALVPSGGQLKLVADRPGDPGLLYSMPGNMIEGSVTRTLGTGQGLIPNTILVQFPDEADGYRPHPLSYRSPGSESEPQREASALTLYSMIRFQHAWWFARYQLEQQRQVQRSLQWTSPLTAMPSEPFDKVAISYETTDYARGFSGFCNSESTTVRVVLDRIVTLAAATTYTVMIRHQATNIIESRTVFEGAGQWGAIGTTAAFTIAPARGDIWTIGVLTTQIKPYVIEEVSQQGEGDYKITASEYVATLYDFPGPGGGPGEGLPENPIVPPTPPPAPPPPGIEPPSAVALQGAFGGSGTIALSWTIATVSAGDSVLEYNLFLSLGSPNSPALVVTLGAEETSYEALTPELFDGYYTVQAVATQGGPGPVSNVVHTDWQFESSSSD